LEDAPSDTVVRGYLNKQLTVEALPDMAPRSRAARSSVAFAQLEAESLNGMQYLHRE